MKKLLSLRALLVLVGLTLPGALLAANIPYQTGPFDPALDQLYNNQLIQALNAGVTPGSMAPFSTQRNFLDNGAMQTNQRAATATCATTSGVVETSYSADRWACDVNMASGAGQLAVVTSTPTPPIGFTNVSTLVRNSGTLGQTQCAWQEIPTIRATQLAGQNVILSAYMEALAGLSADNANQAQMFLITGTGSQQGLGGLRSAVGMTSTVKASSFTISTTTGIITNASTVVAGQPIYMTAATMPVGLTASIPYYVSSTNLNSGTSFSVAATYAGAIAGQVIIPSTGGTTNVLNLPIITPVWTGLAVYGPNGSGPASAGTVAASAQQEFGAAFAQPFTLSATQFNRFSTGPISLPTTVTEAAVAVCFTPLGTATGGSTDGIAFTGVQLEVAGPNQIAAGNFEFRPVEQEYLTALRYAWIVPEPAAAVAMPFSGFYSTTTNCELRAQLPVPMDVIPAVSFTGTTLGTGTMKIVNGGGSGVALASTFMAASTLSTPGLTSVGLAATTGASTAGWGCELIGANGGAVINVGADF